jgi:hypothetical protein
MPIVVYKNSGGPGKGKELFDWASKGRGLSIPHFPEGPDGPEHTIIAHCHPKDIGGMIFAVEGIYSPDDPRSRPLSPQDMVAEVPMLGSQPQLIATKDSGIATYTIEHMFFNPPEEERLL